MNSMYDEYLNIFGERDNWFRFYSRKSNSIDSFNFDTLFKDENSNNFIRIIYFHEGLASVMNKINFPPNRDYHSVSAFLFGILLKNRLTLSMKKLPRVCGDYNKSFIYFWSMVCLSHDITYYIENNSLNYIDKCKSIEDFIVNFKLKYNLIDNSKYGDLLRKYYSYRIDCSTIDHGITCGLIVYDFLMCNYNKHVEFKKQNPQCLIITEDDWKYSTKFPEYALKIAETIARHNIWVATDDYTIKKYKEFNLFELISKSRNFAKISYSEDDSLLFLLGLVDTLDPIKAFAKSDKECYEVLKNISVSFNRKNKEIYIQSSKYFSEHIMDKWNELASWMLLDVECDNKKNSIKIKFNYESAIKEEIVA